jgi:hypothetical protein
MHPTIRIFFTSVLVLLAAHCLVAQSGEEDVVYLKNGGVMRGVILEMTPGQSVKLRTADGNIFVYPMADVERIAKEAAAGDENVRNKMESWYLCFALGYAGTNYPSALQADLDQIKDRGSRFAAAFDIPAVYWPLADRRTLLGGAINAVGDRYELNGSSIDISQVTLGFSVLRFLTGDIGDGLFLRGDLGLASLNVHDSYGTSVSSDAGLGFLLGGGYAIPVSNETRMYLQGYYGSRTVEGDTYRSAGVTLGVML